MSNEESKYGCPECESDQHVIVYELRLHVHVKDVRAWDEEGELAQTNLLDESEGEAPEQYGLDLELSDLNENVERFHCTRCGILFSEPVPLNREQDRDGYIR